MSTANNTRLRWWHRRSTGKQRWWEFPVLIVAAVVVAVVIKTWLVQPFYVPTGSMDNTLHGCPGSCGDKILVNKMIYNLRDPHAGDIVVFHAPPGWNDEAGSTPPSNPLLRALRGLGQLVGVVPPDGEILVKRVIATGGQTVKGDAAGHVFVSNHGAGGPYRELHEPYVFQAGPCSCDAFGPITVPAKRLWVMGDHRDASADSRYHCTPDEQPVEPGGPCDTVASTVPDSAVIGKAVWVIWPASHWRELGTPATFTAAAAPTALPVAPAAAVLLLPFGLGRRRRRPRPPPD